MGIILFDGICNLCNSSVRFIIERDPKREFRFASLQSEVGMRYMKKYHIPDTTDSIVLVMDGKVYVESTAALQIAARLRGPWRIFRMFLLIPKPVRDRVYKWIAKNRYNWFGRNESCMIPSKRNRDRFLEDKPPG
ncbi:thiol-disulfide oxidoreductase DCC family protein [Bacillus haikouensis]|jgi:predicted DCC family thiol-disulfide oxidoreductase YuxK|uniref:thiol-disulfide oxidoreductase DCC family protein n=1 Tax=Bacillus haikouensis TaxID=1510468 RepID=UPI0015548CF1|nr:thiol-disulfide oxidoreductase DCC family protein [Bacillus haikouensis]NQD66873.1 thiol-disulfide oxidoreductase DCC family protein [Bacillus haikouensis]